MQASASKPNKAERTRRAILAAAEPLFARHGFSDTRLEDVAAAVGLKRAALFYHFPDKRALYDAVVGEVAGSLLEQIGAILFGDGPVATRVEAAVAAWVDAVGSRPAIARLILREAAGADPGGFTALLPDAERFLVRCEALLAEGTAAGELSPIRTDPFHAMAAVVGASVFYVAALGSLLPHHEFDPLAPPELAAHKRDMVQTTRRLLGIRTPRPGHPGLTSP